MTVPRPGLRSGRPAPRFARLAEGGPQFSERLERGVLADALVTDASVADRGRAPGIVPVRHDLRVDRAVLPGPCRLLMAGQRVAVLLFTGDAVAVGDQFRALAEGDGPLVGHPRVGQPPAQGGGVQRLRPRGEGPFGLGQHPRRAAHRLHPAGDGHGGIAERDGPGGLDDRLHSRAAEAVDRDAGHGHRQPGEQHRHPCHIAVLLPRAVGVAEVDVVDPGRVQSRRAVHEGLDDMRGEVVGTGRGQHAAVFADGRADGVDDIDVPRAVDEHQASFRERRAASSAAVGAVGMCRARSHLGCEARAARGRCAGRLQGAQGGEFGGGGRSGDADPVGFLEVPAGGLVPDQPSLPGAAR